MGRGMMGKEYIDARGWIYKVVRRITGRGETFMAHYKRPNEAVFYKSKQVSWRGSFAEAQGDLDALAMENGWKVYEGAGA